MHPVCDHKDLHKTGSQRERSHDSGEQGEKVVMATEEKVRVIQDNGRRAQSHLETGQVRT